jgi:hypothetical protein
MTPVPVLVKHQSVVAIKAVVLLMIARVLVLVLQS